MGDYLQFLASKFKAHTPSGVDVDMSSAAHLFPFQRDIVRWALRMGRSAVFADTGLGKTRIQLEWARHIPGDVIILAPLSVAHQTAREGKEIGVNVTVCHGAEDVKPGVNITNYERMHKFDLSRFAGFVLDESSIIKNHTSKTLAMLLDGFRNTPWRLCATATPSPNDWTELATHAELLGVCSRSEMLAEFFVHDMAKTQDWRLKGHAKDVFWKWVSSWGCLIRKPSDIGYSDDGYNLPALNVSHHVVDIGNKYAQKAGFLFAHDASTLMDRRAARVASMDGRVEQCASMVNADPSTWIVWCEYNAEADALKAMIPGAVEIRGSDDIDDKESMLDAFSDGKTRVLITKPSIAGFGLNWQHVNRVAFVGVSDSWESYYQAVRRCWRFGQKNPVDVHLFASVSEASVVKNMQRKQDSSHEMADAMRPHVMASIKETAGTARTVNAYNPQTGMRIPGWLA